MISFSRWAMGLVTKTQIDEGDFTVVVSSAGPRKVRVAALSVTGGGGMTALIATSNRWGGLSSALVQNSPTATTVSTGNNV